MLRFTIFIITCFLFLQTTTAQTNDYKLRETDFVPFPLSQSNDDVLTGVWKSSAGQIKIVKVADNSIGEKNWFIIYFSAELEKEDKLLGFAYDSYDSEGLTLMYWDDDGEMLFIDLGVYLSDKDADESSANSDPYPSECREMMYMIQIKGVSYIRRVCTILD